MEPPWNADIIVWLFCWKGGKILLDLYIIHIHDIQDSDIIQLIYSQTRSVKCWLCNLFDSNIEGGDFDQKSKQGHKAALVFMDLFDFSRNYICNMFCLNWFNPHERVFHQRTYKPINGGGKRRAEGARR